MYSIDDDRIHLSYTEDSSLEAVQLPPKPYYQKLMFVVSDEFVNQYAVQFKSLNLRVDLPRWVSPVNADETGLLGLDSSFATGERSFSLEVFASSPSLADKNYADDTISVQLLLDETVVAETEVSVEADYEPLVQESSETEE